MTAYAHPVLDRRFPAGIRRHLFSDDELDDSSTTSSTPHASRSAPASTSSTSSTVTAISDTSSSAPSIAPARYGGALRSPHRLPARDRRRHPREVPGLAIGVRLSAFDAVPYRKNADEVGAPEAADDRYIHAFGLLRDRRRTARRSTMRALFLRTLESLGIDWVCLTAGSPYYNPHIQRPALFPPSDGYLPPEDPLVGVARQIAAVGMLKQDFPRLAIVGSGYSYLQEWLPHVGQAAVREGLTDFVGLGRMVLSYPELPPTCSPAGRSSAQVDLPHVQRLHQRPAQRPRLRLLPARSLLQVASGRRRS